MTGVLSTARHELVSLRRERLPLVLLVVFVVMVSVSSLIGWLTNTTVTSVWETTRHAGLTTAANPFEHVSALFYARNTVIYLVLIGALMAIVVGVTSAMRDRKAGALDLVLSRPISVPAFLTGKLVGIAAWLAIILAAVGLITWVSISLITGGLLSFVDTGRLIGFHALALVLLLAFVTLGMLSGIHASRETTALLVPIVVWSIAAFVLPQIGTSANPVSLLNPVPSVAPPGGPFDVLNSVLRPLSVTEQFKTAAGRVLGNPQATGNLTVALTVLILALAVGTIALLATRRDTLRGALRD